LSSSLGVEAAEREIQVVASGCIASTGMWTSSGAKAVQAGELVVSIDGGGVQLPDDKKVSFRTLMVPEVTKILPRCASLPVPRVALQHPREIGQRLGRERPTAAAQKLEAGA
jgi:hypothetical protein